MSLQKILTVCAFVFIYSWGGLAEAHSPTSDIFTLKAKKKSKDCWVCTAGTSYYDVPVHGIYGGSRAEVQKEALRVCRIIIDSWGKNPNECKAKGCSPIQCEDSPDPDGPRGCRLGGSSACGPHEHCVNDICVPKDGNRCDEMGNSCQPDEACSGGVCTRF